MFSSSENPDHQIDRMAGCATLGLWVWKWLERLLVTLALYFLALLLYYIYRGHGQLRAAWQQNPFSRFRSGKWFWLGT